MSTRERLVGAATSLFAQQGYTATGTADILEKASAHRGSLYHAFPAKKDLLVAVLEGYRDGIDQRLLAVAWEGVDDPIDRVWALLDRYRRFLIETDFQFGCPIGSLALELREAEPEVRELLTVNFTQWMDRVRQCFDSAASRFPSGTNTAALSVLTLTTMEGGVMLARTFRSLEPFDTAVAALRLYVETLLGMEKVDKSN